MSDWVALAVVFAMIVTAVATRPRRRGTPAQAESLSDAAATETADAASQQAASVARRLYAISADTVILLAMSVPVFIVVPLLQQAPVLRAAAVVGWLITLALYEPILVWRRGGTLGHSLLNLCVVDNRTGGHVSLGRSLARFFVKGLFGLLSYVGMLFLRRPFAVHDVWTGSSVRIKDATVAKPIHYALDRA
jgi:uncharacterized RDD family membrane protein YckC